MRCVIRKICSTPRCLRYPSISSINLPPRPLPCRSGMMQNSSILYSVPPHQWRSSPMEIPTRLPSSKSPRPTAPRTCVMSFRYSSSRTSSLQSSFHGGPLKARRKSSFTAGKSSRRSSFSSNMISALQYLLDLLLLLVSEGRSLKGADVINYLLRAGCAYQHRGDRLIGEYPRQRQL